LSLLLPLTVFMVQCGVEVPEVYKGANVSRSAIAGFEEKSYSNATLEDRFADDRVVIVLNQAASMNFKTYTPKDFPELTCTRVTDSTELTMEVVKQQLEAERTWDWSKLKERIKTGMLVDVDKFRRILDIHFPVKSKENVLEAIRLLEKREDILYAGPDYFMELCALPDPLPSFIGNQMAALNSISLPQAWDITVGNSNTMVGVLDTGIRALHEAFSGQMADNFYHRDFTTGITNAWAAPYYLDDPQGHGTHVAGIIGANGKGVIGVSWNVKLASLRVFNSSGTGNFSYVRYAIDFATGTEIRILNHSGGGGTGVPGMTDMYIALQQYPGLFVCAAGNDNNDNDVTPFYPSNFSYFLNNVISVGAFTIDGNTIRKAINPDPGWLNGSNYGAISVDLFAPGTAIYSTSNGLWYINDSGTSMAAPYVAGVAALVKSLHLNMTGAQLKTALTSTITQLPQLNPYCNTGGIINAYQAVNYIPILGSIDINFNGTGLTDAQGAPVGNILLGKFHLFTNGTYAIAGMGKWSYPIANYSISDTYLECGPVPAGIATYIAQSGLGSIGTRMTFYAPCSDIYWNNTNANWNYSNLPCYFSVYSSWADLQYSGSQYYPGDGLLPTDKRRIYISNW